jgi:hypothetical protein
MKGCASRVDEMTQSLIIAMLIHVSTLTVSQDLVALDCHNPFAAIATTMNWTYEDHNIAHLVGSINPQSPMPSTRVSEIQISEWKNGGEHAWSSRVVHNKR